MISDYPEGGLRMIELISFNKALKSTSVKKYLDLQNHGKWKYLLDWQLQHYGGPAVFARGHLNKHDFSNFISTTHALTTEILQIWSETSYEVNVSSTKLFFFHDLYGITLWYESTRDPYIVNRGAVKVSRTLQTCFKTRIPFYLLMNNVTANFLVLNGLKSSLKSLERNKQRQPVA